MILRYKKKITENSDGVTMSKNNLLENVNNENRQCWRRTNINNVYVHVQYISPFSLHFDYDVINFR